MRPEPDELNCACGLVKNGKPPTFTQAPPGATGKVQGASTPVSEVLADEPPEPMM